VIKLVEKMYRSNCMKLIHQCRIQKGIFLFIIVSFGQFVLCISILGFCSLNTICLLYMEEIIQLKILDNTISPHYLACYIVLQTENFFNSTSLYIILFTDSSLYILLSHQALVQHFAMIVL
jgi:hypothetical protein